VFNLNDYRSKKDSILADENLSQKGKETAISRLQAASKEEARKSVKELRQEAVVKALALRDAQVERLEKTGQAIGSMDYARLNYQVETIKSALKASDSLSEAMEVWEQAKSSNDAYVLKAWKDIAPGLIAERFEGDNDYLDIKHKLSEDIKGAEVKVENSERTADELEAFLALRDIESQAEEVNEAFGAGQAVINRVFEGIKFEGDIVALDFDYQTHKLTDEQEKPKEVAWRLERQYEDRYQAYTKMMTERGYEDFDKDYDKDFSDLSGALDTEEVGG
jgi:hypothetical protein